MTTPPETVETLILERIYTAPREQVFRAWTTASALEQWFQPMGMRIKVTEFEVRSGGCYRFEMAVSETETHAIVGEYLEITRPEKLVFTWRSPATNDEQTLVTIILTERDGKTHMTFTHAGFSSQSMFDDHQVGWLSVIDRIQAVIQET